MTVGAASEVHYSPYDIELKQIRIRHFGGYATKHRCTTTPSTALIPRAHTACEHGPLLVEQHACAGQSRTARRSGSPPEPTGVSSSHLLGGVEHG
jgi:hypothetical protein